MIRDDQSCEGARTEPATSVECLPVLDVQLPNEDRHNIGDQQLWPDCLE